MRNFTLKMEEVRSFFRPASEYAVWPVAFVIMKALSWEPFYLLGLALFVAADLIETPRKSESLVRDLVVAAFTVFLAGIVGDAAGLAVGGVVAISTLALLRRTRG